MYSPIELAEAFIRTGELGDALDVLNQRLESTPGDETARRLRAAVLLRTGDLAVALADLDYLATPTADDHAHRSVILERIGELEGALFAMQQARDLRPDDERLAERHVQLLLAQGQIEHAQALVESLPATWRWLQWAGDLAVQAVDPLRAAERYSSALDLLDRQFDTASPGSAAAIKARLLLVRAECYRQQRDIERAEADYRAAEAIIPNDPLIPFNLALLAAARGDLDTALALGRKAFAGANETLRRHMRDALRREPRHVELAALLDE